MKKWLVLSLLVLNTCFGATNVIANGGFETGLAPWVAFAGDSGSITDALAHSGSQAGVAYARTADYQGISQDLKAQITRNCSVFLTSWVMVNAANTSVTATIKQSDGGGVTYITMGSVWAVSKEWTLLAGQSFINLSGTVSELFIYFQGPPAGVEIYIDDVQLLYSPTALDWKSEANARIESLRKGDVVVSIINGTKLAPNGVNVSITQTSHQFGFGSAVSNDLIYNQQYADFYMKNFEWAVMEYQSKWDQLEPTQGNVQFGPADTLLDLLLRNGKIVRGHCLMWEVIDFIQPWVQGLSSTDLNATVLRHLDETVIHFGTKYVSWDVDNEMLRGSFYPTKLGLWAQPYFYKRAKELAPTLKMFVNDYYNIDGTDSVPYYKQIKSLLDRGAMIDAIGCQGHFPGLVDPVDVYAKLDVLASLGLPIQITEFDVKIGDETLRADNIENLYRIAFSHPSVEAILLWGFWAGAHWRGVNASIVNLDFSLNEAGRRFQSIMKEWTTNTRIQLNSTGQANLRVFHGKHRIDVYIPSTNKTVSQAFELLSGQGPLQVTVDIAHPIPLISLATSAKIPTSAPTVKETLPTIVFATSKPKVATTANESSAFGFVSALTMMGVLLFAQLV